MNLPPPYSTWGHWLADGGMCKASHAEKPSWRLVSTGMHALDGARYLQARGWPLRLTALIAHHSGARFEAAERGLTGQLDELHSKPDRSWTH